MLNNNYICINYFPHNYLPENREYSPPIYKIVLIELLKNTQKINLIKILMKENKNKIYGVLFMFSPLDSPKALSSHQIDLNSQIKNSDLEAPQEEKVSSICTSLFMKINDLQIVRNNQLKNLDTLKKRFNLINQKKISEIQKIKKLKNEGFFQKLKRLFSNSVKKDIELINKNIKNLNNAQ